MGAALAGADDEVVGDLEPLPDVDDLDVVGLLPVQKVGDRDGEVLGFDRSCSCSRAAARS